MAWSDSFEAHIDEQTRVLILGSMPGIKSLQDNQYYAHARNAFWPIMQGLFSIDTALTYPQRLLQLNQHRIGLWDVYYRCYRPGSLDSNIDKNTSQLNDFVALLQHFININVIYFNGKTAETAFCKNVIPLLEQTLSPARFNALSFHGLPSTSPANAAMTFEYKQQQWQVIKKVLSTDA